MLKNADARVTRAFKFLTDEWLVDVATDLNGKCVLIAIALSIIERILFPERPVFFVTAGLRGGGKSTAINMVSLAVLGVRAGAAAWTYDHNERKKALFSYLREGLPMLVWDNISNGTSIGCQHIEAASTTAIFRERVLGESRTEAAPAFTIQVFTGNNISAKGDLASRALEVRINPGRPDPENRSYVHPDPCAWTLDHRGQIINALYTLLMGNPQLAKDCRRPEETRFKMWWRMVGSAIENGAELASGHPGIVSFKALFEKMGGKDEEAEGRIELLLALHKLFGSAVNNVDGSVSGQFTSADVKDKLDEASRANSFDAAPNPNIDIVRAACTLKSGAGGGSAKSIGKALTKNIDAPSIGPDKMIITMKSNDPTADHARIRRFWLTVTGNDGGVDI
jgi:hypothetical protein